MSINQAFRRGDLDCKHINISQTSEIQKLLFNLSQDNINDVRNSSIIFIKNDVSAIQFLLSLKKVVTFRPKLSDLCCQLLVTLSKELNSILTRQFQRKLCLLFRSHYKILLTLYELNIISIDNITDHYLFPYENNLNLLKYFYPEIIEKDPHYYEKHVPSEEIETFLNGYKDKTEDFKEKRKIGINENSICQFIINDDCDNFIQCINSDPVDLTDSIPFSLFESSDYVSTFSEDHMNFIEYCAFYGSSKIFHFLIENKRIFPNSSTLKAAIVGGNNEIIHFLEEKKFTFNIDCYYDAVNSFQNEVAKYILNANNKISITSEVLDDIIPSYNLEIIKSIIELLTSDDFALKAEKNFLNSSLFVAIECNFPEVVEFLLSYRKFLSINYKYENFYYMTPLHKAALSHQIENLKILLNQKGIDTSLADSKIFF